MREDLTSNSFVGTCTFKNGSYINALRLFQDNMEKVTTNAERAIIKRHQSAIDATIKALYTKREDRPLVLLFVGDESKREAMFTTSRVIVKALIAGSDEIDQTSLSLPSHGTLMTGTHLQAKMKRGDARKLIAKKLSSCPSPAVAFFTVDDDIVSANFDLFSTAIEDGARPHVLVDEDTASTLGPDEGSNTFHVGRELSTTNSFFIIVRTIKQSLMTITDAAGPTSTSLLDKTEALRDAVIADIKTELAWEDRFCQRLFHIVSFL